MTYKAIFHVDQNEEQVMNMALNNIANLLTAIPGKKHTLMVLLNGPGVRLFSRDEVKPFYERIKNLWQQGIRFQLCKMALDKFEMNKDQMIDECEIIPSGIVALIDLQNNGFAYIKP